MSSQSHKAAPIAGLLLGAVCSLGCDAVFGIEGGQLARVTADTTWSTDSPPTLRGALYVEDGATLTIEPGTTILADPGSALVIKQGGKINACGTPDSPIVFTSSDGEEKGGGWGGLVIAGRAQVNGVKMSPADDLPGAVSFGGALDDDSSGQLCFVRVEFGGGDVIAGKGLIPLTLRAVGSGTRIDHVQVHGATDDSLLLLGGTVGISHVLVTDGGVDNGIKWEGGWRGKGQFLAVVMSRDQKGNGLEGKNGDAASKIVTSPTIYNATVVGQNAFTTDHGVQFSKGAKGEFWNMLIMNFRQTSLDIADAETIANATNGSLDIRNSAFSNTTNFGVSPDPSFDLAMWALDSAKNNQELPPQDEILRNITPEAPDLAVAASNSPVLSGGAAPPNDGFFDPSATFIGACGLTCTDFEGWTRLQLQ